MCQVTAVARKKTKKTVRSVAFRVTEEFGAWLEAFARRERKTISARMDEALANYAEAREFKKPPTRA